MHSICTKDNLMQLGGHSHHSNLQHHQHTDAPAQPVLCSNRLRRGDGKERMQMEKGGGGGGGVTKREREGVGVGVEKVADRGRDSRI